MAESGGGSKKTLRSGKVTKSEPQIKLRPEMTKSKKKPMTRSSTAYWLLGEPASLKFWEVPHDSEGNVLPVSPDMTGKMLPTVLEVMRHMAFLRLDNPRAPVYQLALETCEIVSVYWNMAKIPVQELSEKKNKNYKAADKLSNLWQEYQVVS